MSNQYPNANPETVEHLGLQGPLVSFEGTALVPLIQDSLAKAGIDPRTYDPAKYGHANYYGLLVDTLSPIDDRDYAEPAISPIVQAVEEGLESGKIVISKPAYGTVRFHPWSTHLPEGAEPYEPNAHLTSKLDTLSMLELQDAETGTVLAYAPRLATDGGRPGRALISTNDVTAGHEPY